MTGPVQFDHRIAIPMDDGRTEYRFRQSWLETFMTCPHKAKLGADGRLERIETDATAVGTSVHAAVEQAIRWQMQHGYALNACEVVDLFDEHWSDYQQHVDRWVKRKIKGATAYGRRVAERWGTYVGRALKPFAVEFPLPRLVVHEDMQRVVTVTGTADYLDQRLGIVDWKTASRPYEAWEKERWSIQSTVYTLALGVLGRLGDPSLEGYDGPTDRLTFCVFPDRSDPEPQWVPTVRHPGHWEFLRRQMLDVVAMFEAKLANWPKRDQHALCSAKWCEAWGDCKGESLELAEAVATPVFLDATASLQSPVNTVAVRAS